MVSFSFVERTMKIGEFSSEISSETIEIWEAISREYGAFLKTNRKVKAAISSFIADDQLDQVRDHDTAIGTWTTLENTYATKSALSATHWYENSWQGYKWQREH